GIRDFHVTGVQTCALPIWVPTENLSKARFSVLAPFLHPGNMYSPDGMTPRGNLVDDAISAIRTNAQMLDTDHGAAGLGALSLWQIGRASCRESVEISEGTV